MKTPLGKIQKVNLREIWSDEARDFTPWLAQEENLQLLGSEIGCDLTLIKTEANVGRYNVDILAMDSDSESKVIIENQLEETNHDHLGKLVTYAAGHDVLLAIWIVKKAKEEHVRAIEWMNEKIGENIGFFLIEIEALKIGNSNPAPRFNIIVRPNQWAKAVKADVASGELTNTKQKQLEFWTSLKSFIENNDQALSCHTPAAQHWYNFAIGTSKAHIALTVDTRKSALACELYITRDKALFNFLSENKEELEKKLGSSCEWIEAEKASRIVLRHSVAELFSENENLQNSNMQWCLDNVRLFRKVFTPYCKDFYKK